MTADQFVILIKMDQEAKEITVKTIIMISIINTKVPILLLLKVYSKTEINKIFSIDKMGSEGVITN